MPSHFFDGLGEQVLGIFQEEVKALFKPQDGITQPIEVIFNDRHQDVDDFGKPYGAPNPRAWFRTGLICPKFGDILEVGKRSYIVREVKDDGLEITELVISESVGK